VPLVETGPVSSTLCRLAAEYAVDLTIVSTHGRSGLKRLFLGSVAERLLRTMGCPLLVVTPTEKSDDASISFKGFGFKQILVGCDFSSNAAHAVDYGFSLAQEFEAAIHLVHVVESFVYRDTLLPDAARLNTIEEVSAGCSRRLEALVPEEAHNWCEINIACESGKPFQALKTYAEAHAIDLIILGMRGHGLVETMLLGSTTDRVIRGVACPVLSVCPP
jgi:nucleotide-binding universal stress UspA family protein